MNRYLLDTHTFLWMVGEEERLARRVRQILLSARNECFLSVASAWEIGILVRIGRIRLPRSVEEWLPETLRRTSLKPLPLRMSIALRATTLPMHHKDPFDRLLVATAQLEDLTLLSKDPQLLAYDIPVLWE